MSLPTTKAATSVLKCKRKPTRQSLSLESCQCLRHLPSTELLLCSPLQAFIFSQCLLLLFLFFFFIHTVPLLKMMFVCVPRMPHWGSKWQAGSIKTDLIVRWRDSAECLWMCWCSARTVKVLRNKSQRMKGAGVIAASGGGGVRLVRITR